MHLNDLTEEQIMLCQRLQEIPLVQGIILHTWLFLQWFYFRKFRESDFAKISTSIYVYL